MSDIMTALMKRAGRMKPPPTVLNAILGVIADERHERADLTSVIATDVAMTGAVLKLANSPAFARRSGRKLASVDEAAGILGERAVVQLVMNVAAAAMKGGASGYGLVAEDLWHKSLRTALAADRIALHKELPCRSSAYCAGLFLDVGKLVMSSVVGKLDAERGDVAFDALERDTFGIDHAELGARIAERWGLPEDVVEGVRHHHRPSAAPASHRVICSVSHFADALATMTGKAVGVDCMGYELDASAVEMLAIDEVEAAELMMLVRSDFADAAGQLEAA